MIMPYSMRIVFLLSNSEHGKPGQHVHHTSSDLSRLDNFALPGKLSIVF